MGVSLCVVGVAVLLLAGPLPALISLACIVSYVAFYTPLKTKTTMATFIGAIPGALPPLIGWTAASKLTGFDSLYQPGGLSLFALMFAWQIPHFMAIAWMYRDDYAKGGYMVLPVVDPSGKWTALTVALWTIALIPATLLPASVMPDSLGTVYLMIAGRLRNRVRMAGDPPDQEPHAGRCQGPVLWVHHAPAGAADCDGRRGDRAGLQAPDQRPPPIFISMSLGFVDMSSLVMTTVTVTVLPTKKPRSMS